MPSTGLATAWQRPCSHLDTQPSSARAGPSRSSLLPLPAACRYPGGHSTASSNNRGVGRRCKEGWGTSCLRSRPRFAPGSYELAMSAVSIAAFRQPSSSSPVQPCPLHACLALYGITDLAAFSAPRHLALSQEEVSSNVEPKLAALAAEGLGPKQIVQLVAARSTASILSCSYKDTFMPILQLLRQIGAYTEHQAHPKSPHLTAAGKALADNPTVAAQYLCRDPGKVQELLQWLEGSLDVGMKQLAACNSLCSALCLSTGAANAICMSLQEQQVPAGQVAHMLLRQPTAFGLKPRVLSARLGTLQQHLGLDAAAALQLAMAHPRLLTNNVEARLPPLLDFLDGYMGEHGAGRRLVRAQPPLGSVTAKAAERSVGKLAVRGCSQQQIRGMINRTPTLLKLNLDSPLQRQKLEWIERVLPWTLDDFVSVPACLTYSTSRLAPRLALLRELKLQPPSTPGCLAAPSSVTFMATVRKQLAGQGREVPWASWAEWEEGWLGTEEGKEWASHRSGTREWPVRPCFGLLSCTSNTINFSEVLFLSVFIRQ